MSKQMKFDRKDVFTPLGRGRIVYELPDGTLVVEFEHGSGHIFRVDELFSPLIAQDAAGSAGPTRDFEELEELEECA